MVSFKYLRYGLELLATSILSDPRTAVWRRHSSPPSLSRRKASLPDRVRIWTTLSRNRAPSRCKGY